MQNIIIKRGQSNETVVLRVLVGVEAEKIVDDYVNLAAGDTYYVAPPIRSGLPEGNKWIIC